MKDGTIVPEVDAVVGKPQLQDVSHDPRDLLGLIDESPLRTLNRLRREIEQGHIFIATVD
jgi:hypothetical protein